MDCGTITNSISEHFPVYIIKKKESIKHNDITFQGRSYRNFNEDMFRDMLSSYNWGKFYASFDVETAWTELYQYILYVADFMCPVKTFKFKDKKPQWFNDDLIEMSVNRDEFF